jgi:hypothetical protein
MPSVARQDKMRLPISLRLDGIVNAAAEGEPWLGWARLVVHVASSTGDVREN